MVKRDMTYLERLKRPSSIVDVVIDTDMYNEIDDLYALAYLILSSDKLNLQGIFAAPFYSPASMGRVMPPRVRSICMVIPHPFPGHDSRSGEKIQEQPCLLGQETIR